MIKRIVFDCERMKYPDTGLYHYCLNLGRHISKQADTACEELHFFSPPGVEKLFGKKSLHLHQHSLQKFFLPSTRNYHIWHCTYQNSNYIPFRNKKIKVVLSVHDLNFLYEKKQNWKKQKYLRHLQGNIDRADAIVCISEFCRHDVLDHCRLNNKPLVMIHNGTNTLKRPLLNQQSYKPRKPFLFTIGVVTRKKNFHTLLPLLQKNRDMELLIAGRLDDSDYLRQLQHTAEQLDVAENLRVLGQISEGEKAWYFENCYAFTFPSLAEGFGLPVTEAMSAGKPLFLSDKTALPEIGEDLAFYFHDFGAESMQQVFQHGMHEYNKRNMEADIKKHGARFCWTKAANEYLELYRSLY